MAGTENVRDLTLMDENGRLARADNELRAVLDLISISWKSPDQCVLAVVDPFDDIDQFLLSICQRVPSLTPILVI